jgi:8-oxo-dGTP pyrophosphatase MutT (NUDIX family)
VKEISAGGIVFKQVGQELKVLMIEDRYHKMTVPKGKQEAGETLEQTAIREIEEETGIQGSIIQPLNKVYYQYTDQERGHIDKEVTYYLVQAIGGEVDVQIEEINQVFWMDIEAAREAQQKKGYGNNQEIFDAAYQILKEK